MNHAFAKGRESADIDPDGIVTVDYQDGAETFRAADGMVPCRFKIGDKVKRSSYSDPAETVERIEWVRTVWHSIEPYWAISTDMSSGPQAGYVRVEKGDGDVRR